MAEELNREAIAILKGFTKKVEEQLDSGLDRIQDEAFKLVKEKNPVGTEETSSVYPGFSRDQWTKQPGSGKERWITNNAHYINVLEFGGNPWAPGPHLTAEGYSTQAPQGMARLTVHELAAAITSGRFKVFKK